jgi:hypothetical protein
MTTASVQFSLVFIDLTTGATPSQLKPGPVMQPMIDAILWGLMGDLAAEYGERTVAMRVGSESDRAPNEIAVHFRDTLPGAPGALAYHTVTAGVPDIEVGVDLFEGLTSGADPMSVGVDHEIKELLGDIGANGWKDRQDGSTMDAEELCDFVQNTFITAPSGVQISNFVKRAFFIPGAPGPWDQLGAMSSQYDVSHGYGITATPPSTTAQIGGMRESEDVMLGMKSPRIQVVGSLTVKQAIRKSHELSRTMRRGVHPSHVHFLVQN